MALPTPFETKRKKAPIGGLGRIQYLNVADGTRLRSNLLWVKLHLTHSTSTRMDLIFNKDAPHRIERRIAQPADAADFGGAAEAVPPTFYFVG